MIFYPKSDEIKDIATALQMNNPEECYYEFKNVFNKPEQRNFLIKVICKESQYAFLLVSRYRHMLTDQERHLLFDSVLDNPSVSLDWFTTIKSSDEEKVLLANSIIDSPKHAAELIANYPAICGEVREILFQCIDRSPTCGEILYARAKLTDEEADRVIETMANNVTSLNKLLQSFVMLGEFARTFTMKQKDYLIDKAIEFSEYEVAYMINFMPLSEEQQFKLTPLLVARRLMQSR